MVNTRGVTTEIIRGKLEQEHKALVNSLEYVLPEDLQNMVLGFASPTPVQLTVTALMLKKSNPKQSEDLLRNSIWEEIFKKEFPKAYIQESQKPIHQWWKDYWKMMFLCRYPSFGGVDLILNRAIALGTEAVLSVLIGKNIRFGTTSILQGLYTALVNERAEVFGVLLTVIPDVNDVSYHLQNNNVLHFIAQARGELLKVAYQQIKFIATKKNVNVINYATETPLHCLTSSDTFNLGDKVREDSYYYKSQILCYLLDLGADIEAIDGKGRTVLSNAWSKLQTINSKSEFYQNADVSAAHVLSYRRLRVHHARTIYFLLEHGATFDDHGYPGSNIISNLENKNKALLLIECCLIEFEEAPKTTDHSAKHDIFASAKIGTLLVREATQTLYNFVENSEQNIDLLLNHIIVYERHEVLKKIYSAIKRAGWLPNLQGSCIEASQSDVKSDRPYKNKSFRDC
jgi:hypothetical protein